MKVLFVRPKPSKETIGLQHVMVVEPLEFELLAAVMDKADNPVIVDMILEKKEVEYFIRREKPDVFCVTGYLTNVPEMIEYCGKAKNINPDIVTIAGGVHCEVCPDDLNTILIDYRVIRNGVSVFPELLKHIKGNGDFPACVLKAGENPGQCRMLPFDFNLPFADRSLTARYRDNYFYIFHDKVALIKTSFGCPYSCSFCFCKLITGGSYYERPLQQVAEELLTIEEENIYIVDDDFLVNSSRVIEFIELCKINNIRKKYLVYGRADFIAANPGVIKEFGKNGLKTVIVGVESFNDEELKKYNKNTTSAVNSRAIETLNENKIDCYATVIIPPNWEEKDFKHCGSMLKSLGIHYVNLQPYTPLPGTGAGVSADRLLIPYSDYAKWDLAHVTVRPDKMSVSDFYGQILNLYRDVLFQPRVILKYLRMYSLRMIVKMFTGSLKVWLQYNQKRARSKNG